MGNLTSVCAKDNTNDVEINTIEERVSSLIALIFGSLL